MNWSDDTVEMVALDIIVARDGKRDGERRFNDSVIRKAYIGDAKAALAAVAECSELKALVEAVDRALPYCNPTPAKYALFTALMPFLPITEASNG